MAQGGRGSRRGLGQRDKAKEQCPSVGFGGTSSEDIREVALQGIQNGQALGQGRAGLGPSVGLSLPTSKAFWNSPGWESAVRRGVSTQAPELTLGPWIP